MVPPLSGHFHKANVEVRAAAYKTKTKEVKLPSFHDSLGASGVAYDSLDSMPFARDWGVELPTAVVYYDVFRVGSTREEVDIRMIEAKGGAPVD